MNTLFLGAQTKECVFATSDTHTKYGSGTIGNNKIISNEFNKSYKIMNLTPKFKLYTNEKSNFSFVRNNTEH